MKKIRLAWEILGVIAIFLVTQSSVWSSEYNLGYACRTNGLWTQAALAETAKLVEVLNQLKDNENCKGLEGIVADLMATESKFKKSVDASSGQKVDKTVDGIDDANLNGQKDFLNGMINDVKATGKNYSSMVDLLAGVHMNSAINSTMNFTDTFSASYLNNKYVIDGLGQSASELTSVVNRALTALVGPKLDQCLVEAPDQGLVLVSGMMRLVANTSMPGVSVVANRVGETIANFVQYMRQSKFAKTLRAAKQSELWASISCAIESSSENYCSALDQMKLLKWGLLSMEKKGVYNVDDPSSGNFLTGYYVLVRNVPVVAKWLLKVQFGVEPNMMTDATNKNSIWDTVLGIVTSINTLKAIYKERERNILRSQELKNQKNMIFELLQEIKQIMSRAVVESGGSEINFYTVSNPMDYLSLILIGMEEKDYPKDILPKENGMIIAADAWLKNGGRFRYQFDEPEKLLQIIKINLEKIIESAQIEMRKFFIDRLIIDKMNLVAEAFTIDSMGTSVDDSIKIIALYLEGLKDRVERSPFGDEQVTHLINDTLIQLGQVMIAIDNYGKFKSGEKEMQKAAEKVIDSVYEEFNVLVQRDSFITNRLATLVQYDYFLQVLENKNMSQYEKDLLIISNNEAYQKLILSHGENPALAREDYDNALMIHRRNIDNLESIFRNNYLDFLQTTMDDARGIPVVLRNTRSLYNIFNDNILALPKSVLGYKYRYQMEIINPFNPNYKRGNIFTGGDTEDHAFKANHDRTCIQLLASPAPRHVYSSLCSGAVITSPFFEAAEDPKRKEELSFLNVDFNSYTKLFKEKLNDERICAYRNYLRRNQVHWMTLQHNQIKEHKRKSAKKETHAGDILERAKKRVALNQLAVAEKKKKDAVDQMKVIDTDLLKMNSELTRTKSKIESRQKNLESDLKMAGQHIDAQEIKKRRDEISKLQEKVEELEEQISKNNLSKDMLMVEVTQIGLEIEELKKVDMRGI